MTFGAGRLPLAVLAAQIDSGGIGMLERQCTLVAFTSPEAGWNDARTMADRQHRTMSKQQCSGGSCSLDRLRAA
jgi:hypothetical protein